MKKMRKNLARRIAGMMLGVLLMGTTVSAAEVPAEPSETDVIRQEIVTLTNRLRTEQGLPALAENELLAQAAQVRAEELAAATLYAHTRPDGTHYSTVTDCKYVGENLHRVSFATLRYKDLTAAEYTVSSWSSSEGHRLNMMNPQAASIGVGIAEGVNSKGDPCWYCVQLFLLDGYTITWVDAPILGK